MSDETNGTWTQGEVVRSLRRIEANQQEARMTFASKQELSSYRELVDTEHKEMREDISGIRDGLRWAFRLGVTMVLTNVFAFVLYLITVRPHP